MATLSIQVRLGLSRGWRVRSLIKAKFYAQSVIHCLFIFSFLRAKGLSDRMWTLNYGVYTNNTRYFIYVEYFRLPGSPTLLRQTKRLYLTMYFRPRLAPYSYLRQRLFALYPLPQFSKVNLISRSLKKNPGRIEKQENLYWAWDRRAALMSFVIARMRVNKQLYVPEVLRSAASIGDRIA